jgi:hypothetical protein
MRIWQYCLALLLLWPAALLAQDTAQYQLRVEVNWQAEGEPDNPHWSRLLAVTHTSRYSLFADGETASSGLALVATNGRVSVLEAELAEAARRNRAGHPVVVPGLPNGQGVFEMTLTATERMHYVSFATMLAPSPDWFTGLSAVPLRDNTGWIETVRVPLWVWDAGADSGSSFTSANEGTQPRESVRLLTHPAFLRSDGLRPIGWEILTRQP